MKGKVTEDENASIAKLGQAILQNKDGISYFEDENGKNLVYYKQIPELGWNIVLSIPQKELYAPINKLLISIGTIILVICVLVTLAVSVFSNYITKSIKEVNDLSHSIADGDLTQTIKVRNKNELGANIKQYSNRNKYILRSI